LWFQEEGPLFVGPTSAADFDAAGDVERTYLIVTDSRKAAKLGRCRGIEVIAEIYGFPGPKSSW